MTRRELGKFGLSFIAAFILCPTETLKAFTEYETVSIRLFCEKVKHEIGKLKNVQVQKDEFSNFCKKHGIASSIKNFEDYLIAKMNFEAFRYAGFMRFTYIIPFLNEIASPNVTINQLHGTAQKGGFKAISQKSGRTIIKSAKDRQMAIGASYALVECDTAAAFYSYITQRMGVDSGLIWPTWNHAIAYSSIGGKRIRVPITDMDFGDYDRFGTDKFTGGCIGPVNPKYDGGKIRQDIPKDFMSTYLNQLAVYGKASDKTLQHLRYARNLILGGPETTQGYLPWTSVDKQAVMYFLQNEGAGLKKVCPLESRRLRSLSR